MVLERQHTVEEEIKEAGEDEESNERGKLISKEEREKGAVALRVYLSYAKACGYPFVVIALFLAVVAQGRFGLYSYLTSLGRTTQHAYNTKAITY